MTHNDVTPHQQCVPFPEGKDVLSFCPLPELRAALQWHGDTLYPPINPFPPLVLLSLKVTSVWLPLQTCPVHFIAELYIWTPSRISHKPHPPPPALLKCTPRSRLIPPTPPPPPPPLFTAEATDSDKLPLQQNLPILASLKRLLGADFISSRLKYCT